jgi:hypothetical protein
MKEPKEKVPTHSPEYIRSLSERLYRILLAEDAGGNDPAWRAQAADRMIAKDNEAGKDGQKLFSNRAGQYDRVVRHMLDILEIKP